MKTCFQIPECSLTYAKVSKVFKYSLSKRYILHKKTINIEKIDIENKSKYF